MEKITHYENMTDHQDWNESYYFVFYSKNDELGGMSRIGFKPNKREAMTFFFLFLPDGSAAGYHQQIKQKNFTSSLKVRGMEHGWKPSGKWTYKFKGKMIFVKNSQDLARVKENPKLISDVQSVSMDLSYDPINKPYEYSEFMTPESREIGKKSGDKHWEQVGVVSGKINLNNKEFLLKQVMAQRDHTYGVRDWTGVGDWFYYVVWFNENLAINPAAIITNDGRVSTGGFLFKDGKNIPLKSLRVINQTFQDDNVFPISSELELIDAQNDRHILKAKVGPIIPVNFQDSEGNRSILVQSFGTFELDGIKGGYGAFETLRRARKVT